MADIKISALPTATAVTDADIVVINQGGVTKTAARSLIKNTGTVTSVAAGTGLTGGTITGSGTLAVSFGSTAGTAAEGNDARLSNARTPTAHKSTHATGGTDALAPSDIGAVPTTRTVSAGTGLTGGGDLTADRSLSVSFGTSAGTAAQGNDSRLSDSRTPTAHASTHASGGSDQITSLALTSGTITAVPSAATDIVNKSYADSIATGINFHDACDYATIAALSPSANYNQPGGAGVGVNATLTGSTNVALQVDGVTVATGKRILVKDQSSGFQNGVYVVSQQGDGSTQPYILTRASDYDTSGTGINEVQAGDFLLVLSGNSLANSAWVQQTPAPISFGSTSIVFTQFSGGAGVSTFSAGTTGLTPSVASNGPVTLAGTLNVANGGTGQTSYTNGQLLIGNSTGNTLTKATLTAGNGIVITNGAGSINVGVLTQTSYGFSFPGNGSLGMPSSLGLSGDFTVEVFINRGGVTTVGHVLCDQVNGAVLYTNGTTITFAKTGGSTIVSGTLTSDSNWHHVAIVRQSGTAALYVDGTRLSSVADSTSFTPTGNCEIGALYNTTGFFNGKIASIRISNIARYSGTTLSVPTSAFLTDANTTFLYLQSATVDAGLIPHGAGSVSSVTGPFSTFGVSSFSGGTTGLTPSSVSAGAITLGGTLATANGGTGQTTYSNGQLLIGNASGSLSKATLTAGANVTITNGDGTVSIASAAPPAGGVYEFFEHFLSSTSPFSGNMSTSNSGGSLSSSGAYTSKFGVVAFNTGVTNAADQRAAINNAPTAMSIGGSNNEYYLAASLAQSSAGWFTGTSTGFFRFGFLSVVAQTGIAEPTSGVYFRATNSNAIEFVTRNGSVETSTSTGVSLANGTFNKYEILINAAATQVIAKIDGTVVATHTTNIPISTNRVGVIATIQRVTADTNGYSFVIDWLYMKATPSSSWI